MRVLKRSFIFVITLVVALFALVGCGDKEVQSISIDTTNLTLQINEGEQFDFSNLKVVAHYLKKDLDIDLSEVTIDTSLVDTTKAGEYSVTVKYGDFEEFFKVKVVAVVRLTDIEVDTSACVLNIKEGESLDLSKIKVKAVYSNGNKEELAANAYTLDQSAVKLDTAGTYSVKVTYQGIEKSFNVTITKEDAPVLENITVSGAKANFMLGEAFATTGLVVTAHYSKGSDKDVTASAQASQVVIEEEGDYIVTVSYSEGGVTKTATYTITVVDKIASIAVVVGDGKVEYAPGEELDILGVSVVATLKDDTTLELVGWGATLYDLEGNVVADNKLTKTADYVVKVTYGKHEATYTVSARVGGYISISTVEEFLAMRDHSGAITDKYILTTDLDFDGVELSEALSGEFKGELNGDGHKLSNIVFNTKTAKVGALFNTINGGTIKNLTLFSCYASSSAESLGLIAGLCTNGTFENLEFSCCTVASTSSSGYAALIAGRNASAGTISMSKITVKNLTSVSGVKYVGGLIADLTKDTTITINDVDVNITCTSGSQMSALVGRARSGSVVNVKNAIIRFEIGVANTTNKTGALIDGADAATLNAENVIIASSTCLLAQTNLTQSGLFKGQGKATATLKNCFYVGLPALANYTKTTDTELNASKQYYEVVSGAYVAVATPDVANIANYFEMSIDGGAAYVIGDTVLTDLAALGFDLTNVWEADSRFVVKLKDASANTPAEDATVVRLQVNANNAKTQYYALDSFDPTGIIVIATYSDGVVIPLNESQYGVKILSDGNDVTADFVNLAVGKYTVEVEAGSAKASYNIDIVQEVGVEVIASEGKTVYRVGDVLDTKGIITFILISDNTKKLATSGQVTFAVVNADESTQGADVALTANAKFVKVTRTVNGEELSDTYPIYVLDNEYSDTLVVVYVKPQTNGLVDGKMYFENVNLALNYLRSLSLANDTIKEIRLAKGTYTGALTIDMANVRIVKDRAEDLASEVIIACGNAADTFKLDLSATFGTEGSATVTVKSNAVGFYAYGVTFANTFDYRNSTFANKQALALLCQADKAVFVECRFLGVQDTLEPKNGRQYYKDCYIEGAVDFIFGNNATVLFEGCEIHSVTRYKSGTNTPETNQGYICAPKGFSSGATTDAVTYGYVFLNCNFTADSDVPAGSVSIARPWGDQAKVAILNSTLGAHISTLGYDGNSKSRYADMSGNLPTGAGVVFAEYNNTGDGAINTAVAGATILTESDAANYTAAKIFAATNGLVKYDAAWVLPDLEEGYYVLLGLETNLSVGGVFDTPTLVHVSKTAAIVELATFEVYNLVEEETIELDDLTSAAGTFELRVFVGETKVLSAEVTVRAGSGQVVVNTYTFNATDLEAKEYTADFVAGTSDYFTLHCTSGKKYTIDGNNKSLDGMDFTKRLKFNGASGEFSSERFIEFEVQGTAHVKVYALSSSSSDNTRKVVLYDSIGTNVGESTVDGKTFAAYEFDLTAAGTYFIGCEVNGINIYYIEVVDTVTK